MLYSTREHLSWRQGSDRLPSPHQVNGLVVLRRQDREVRNDDVFHVRYITFIGENTTLHSAKRHLLRVCPTILISFDNAEFSNSSCRFISSGTVEFFRHKHTQILVPCCTVTNLVESECVRRGWVGYKGRQSRGGRTR